MPPGSRKRGQLNQPIHLQTSSVPCQLYLIVRVGVTSKGCLINVNSATLKNESTDEWYLDAFSGDPRLDELRMSMSQMETRRRN